MKTRLHLVVLLVLVSPLWSVMSTAGQTTLTAASSREAVVVDSAAEVLGEVMSIPGQSIPGSLLAKAEGIAIIPGMLKGGFIVGVRYGRGVIVTRDEAGRWKPPMFVQITGASVGWQAGVQGTDLVLVFRTKSSLQNLMRGKFTIGVHASAAAGPVGREAEAATDATLKAEIYSYSRSRGLFAGVALDGAVLSVDQSATNAYYQSVGGNLNQPGQPSPLPASAARLLEQIAKLYDHHRSGAARRCKACRCRSPSPPPSACRFVAAARRDRGRPLADVPRPARRGLLRRPPTVRRGPPPFARPLRDRRRRSPLSVPRPAPRVPNHLVTPPPILRRLATCDHAAIVASPAAGNRQRIASP